MQYINSTLFLNRKRQQAYPAWCGVPEELVHPQASSVPGEAHSVGDKALHLAGDGSSLEVIPRGRGRHHNLRGICHQVDTCHQVDMKLHILPSNLSIAAHTVSHCCVMGCTSFISVYIYMQII